MGTTSHSGKRTWLTELSSKGVGVRVLAEMAGHASIQTTQRCIDVNDEQMRRAADMRVHRVNSIQHFLNHPNRIASSPAVI